MVYGNMQSVRGLAGILSEYKQKVKLGTGDGSTLEFDLPSVGNTLGFIIDVNGTTSSTITTDDITVYVNDVPVTVSSIDEDKGSVILASAPATGAVVKADYKWSVVSDQQVLDAMAIAEIQTDRYILGKNTSGNTWTEYKDGDGVTTVFYFDKSDVTSVDIVIVDDNTLSLSDEDYYLYKYPNEDFYKYIRFSVAPLNDYQNIELTYTYGQNDDYLVNHLSDLFASKIVLLQYVRSKQTSGQYIRGKQEKQPGQTTRLAEIDKSIINIISMIDRRIMYKLS